MPIATRRRWTPRAALLLSACIPSAGCQHTAREPAAPATVAVTPPPSNAQDEPGPARGRDAAEARNAEVEDILRRCRTTTTDGKVCHDAGKLLNLLSRVTSRCEKGDREACSHVPAALADASSEQLDQGALEAFQRGCELDHAECCLEVGTEHAVQDRRELAEQLFDKGCRLGSSTACQLRGTTTPAR